MGTFIPIKKAVVKKKQPMGIAAFPNAASVDTKIQGIIFQKVKNIPSLEQTKKRVMMIKAAHPFILIMEQRGRLKEAIFSEIPKRFFAQSSVKGRVALDDFEKNAMERAGRNPFPMLRGDSPLSFKKRGRMIKPWIRLAAITQIPYKKSLLS